jgi:hypothetical protein
MLKIALIPYYHRFSQTEFFGFIFLTIVDKTIDKTIVNCSRENETKKFGLRKPDKRIVNYSTENETKKFGLGKDVVIWD